MTEPFSGVIPAMVTPFKGGEVDEEALRRHVEFLIEGGVDAILPCGTTGESPTLSHEEHNRVIEIAIDQAKRRVPVLAGTGSNSTREAIAMSDHAKGAGADGLLLVSPYYNKPTQEGLYRHFTEVAKEAPLPIILYNIPGRCGVEILPETVKRLSEHPSIVGVKEATGDLSKMIRVIELCGPDFTVTSGDDALTLPLLAVGGKGVISVAANIIPGPMAELWAKWKAGDLQGARALFFRMLPLFRALFLETNPTCIKYAMYLAGRMGMDMRLPMLPASEGVRARIAEAVGEWVPIKEPVA
ncbi:MAG: 4-hydroxy-tetrahydrodipicolinate synthase [Deltaproteobacteria bacterium]|jgi:4-hydroxy-tetrahydrodipicolinate synthase|nr:4-hydroxy-tetrahydrodipicolinate synthase [Deltaproteobacteria bacterium]